MSDHSRRGFLALAGLGTAGVAAASLPGAAGAADADTTLPADAAGAMAVFVDDVRAGRVTLMIEGAEVEITDKKLTAQIVRAYRRAQ
jgi:hypothetical protein